MKKKRRMLSLRTKLLISVVGVVLLFLSFSTYFSIAQTGEIIKEQTDTYGTSMSRTLANFCIEDLLSWNYPALQLSIDYIGDQDKQILGIEIYHEGLVVADYLTDNDTEVGEKYKTPVIINTSLDNRELGAVVVYLSEEKYQDFLRKEIRLLLILSLVLLIGDTILSYLTVKLLILNPLKNITEGARIIGSGDFEHHINIQNQDEIGDLAQTINAMTVNLKASQNKIKGQTSNLKETKKALMNILEDTEIAKQKVEEEQNKTFAIISNLVDPVLVINNDLRLILVNPSAKKIFNIHDKDIGKKIMDCTDRSCTPRRLCLCDFHNILKVPYYSKVLKSNEKGYPTIEEIFVGSDNSKAEDLDTSKQKVYKVFTSPVIDERNILHGHMKIFYDLTKEKTVDRLKSEFISIAAHQLRTPSSGVKWALRMILDGELGDISKESKEYLKKAYSANNKMITLINDLLNVSRMESGKFIYELKKIDLSTLLKESIEDSKITAQERNIELKLKITCPESSIMIDEKKIKLSIHNLLTNAIKYSKDGGEVEINLTIDKDDKDYTHISVKDSGIGINEKDKKRLFSKFFRCENAIRLQTEGSGLGLFIVKNVIIAHKGQIWLESKINEGSTFHIKLPINLDEVNQKNLVNNKTK